MVNVVSVAIGIFGLLLALWFGIRSLFQSQDLEALQKATRAYNQGLFNNIWRMGANAENALKAPTEAAARELVRGIADMSQTARQVLIAFSREHTRFVPYQDEAWQPRSLEPEPPKKLWRRLFRI